MGFRALGEQRRASGGFDPQVLMRAARGGGRDVVDVVVVVVLIPESTGRCISEESCSQAGTWARVQVIIVLIPLNIKDPNSDR